MKSNIRKYLPDGFISCLLLMIILAYLIPGIGKEGETIELKYVIKYGIAFLFFFYGLRLNPEKIRRDISNWKIHIVIQSITYIIFPLVVLSFYPFFAGTENEILWLSVFFLSIIPSTVSSSVVMVSIAEGNVTSAIFNASISGIIGIFITPLWISLFWNKNNGSLDFGSVLTDLILQIMVPLFAGLLLHNFLGKWATRNKKRLSLFDNSVILLIVYNSFSDAFDKGVFSEIQSQKLLFLFAALIALFFIIFEGTKKIIHLFHFNREDGITVLFCGSKKSLVHGSVMISVLFPGNSIGSLLLVSVMIYHAFQLFYISIVAHKYQRQFLSEKIKITTCP